MVTLTDSPELKEESLCDDLLFCGIVECVTQVWLAELGEGGEQRKNDGID
jgi:hypothetical protein